MELMGMGGAAKPQLMGSLCEGLLISLVNLSRDIRLSSAVHYHKYINPTDYELVFVKVGLFSSLY